MSVEIGILVIVIIMIPSVIAASNTARIMKELNEIRETLQVLSKQKENT